LTNQAFMVEDKLVSRVFVTSSNVFVVKTWNLSSIDLL